MFQLLQIITVVIIAIAMALSLAHALELHLDRDTYLAVQTIYYPGFTIGGISEPVAILATLMLLIAIPTATTAFWITLAALIALALMHLIFWLVTQPVNRFWLAAKSLGLRARGFSR